MPRLRPRSFLIALVSLTLLAGAGAPAIAQEASPEATPAASITLLAELGYPELRVTFDGTTHDFPTELEAGRYHVVIANESQLDIDFAFVQEQTAGTPEDEVVRNGGLFLLGETTSSLVLDLTPGAWIISLYAWDPVTNTDTLTGTRVTVTGELPALEDPPGQEIVLRDTALDAPARLPAGPQVWHVVNRGEQESQLTLDRVPAGTTVDQVVALLSREAGTPVAGSGPTFEDITQLFWGMRLAPGQFNLYAFDLAPGTYALTSTATPDGTVQGGGGMVAIVTVG